MTAESHRPSHTTEEFAPNCSTQLPFHEHLSGNDDKSWPRQYSASKSTRSPEQLDDSGFLPGLYNTESVDTDSLHPLKTSNSEPSEMRLSARPRRSSATPALGPSHIEPSNKDAKRKKHSSLFGMFSLKEPSTSAFEDFARQQQRHAASKGGRMTAVGMAGTSSQKLPTSVPKVNSKWDGLPSSASDKTKEARNIDRDSVISVASRSSRSSSSRLHSQASFSSTDVRTSSPPILPFQPGVGSDVGRRHALQSSPLDFDGMEQKRCIQRMSSPAAIFAHPPLPKLALVLPSAPSPRIPMADQEYRSRIIMPKACPGSEDDAAYHNYELWKYDYTGRQPLTTWSNDSDDVLVRSSGPGVLAPPLRPRGSLIERRESQPKPILKQRSCKVQPGFYTVETSDSPADHTTPSAVIARSPTSPQIVSPAGLAFAPLGSSQNVDKSRPRTVNTDALPWESEDPRTSSEALCTSHPIRQKQKKRSMLGRRVH